MSQRHHNALTIQQGFRNPAAIAYSIIEACRECRAENLSTAAICADPAVRLMVHQLAFLTRAGELDLGAGAGTSQWTDAMNACQAVVEAEKAKEAAKEQSTPQQIISK